MVKIIPRPLWSAYRLLKKYRFFLIAAGLFVVALTLIGEHLKDIILIPLLFIAASFSTIYRRFLRAPPSFELISLATVTIGVTHGPVAGALFGATSMLAAEIISGGLDAFVIGYVAARFVMGALAGVFASADIVMLGLVLTVVFNILAQALYLLQGDPEAKLKTAIFVFFNVGINWILFSRLGGMLVQILR